MEQKVYCPKCNKEYANRSNLARHCANKHAWSIAKSAPIPPEQQSAKNQEDSDVEPDSESEAPGTTLDETTEAVKNLLAAEVPVSVGCEPPRETLPVTGTLGSAPVNPAQVENPQKPKEEKEKKGTASKKQQEQKEFKAKKKLLITKSGTKPPSEVKRARSVGRPGEKFEPALTVKAQSLSEFPFLEGKLKKKAEETKDEVPIRKRFMATQPHCPPKKIPMSNTSVPKAEDRNPQKALPESSVSEAKNLKVGTQKWPNRASQPPVRDIIGYRKTLPSTVTPAEIGDLAKNRFGWGETKTVSPRRYVQGVVAAYDAGRKAILDTLHEYLAESPHANLTPVERLNWIKQWADTEPRPHTPDQEFLD